MPDLKGGLLAIVAADVRRLSRRYGGMLEPPHVGCYDLLRIVEVMVVIGLLSLRLVELLGNLSISRHGRSSVEFVFIDDLKPERREQSGKEQWI
jgi:hypothetical protein